jgi:outer membrane lipoprotein-sorting protein
MRSRLVFATVLLCLAGSVATVAEQRDLPRTEEAILKAWSKHRSFRANMRIETTSMDDGSLLGESTGTFEMMTKGDKNYVRRVMATSTDRRATTQPIEETYRVELTIDGEFAYAYVKFKDSQVSRKRDIMPLMTLNPTVVLPHLHEDSMVETLPDGEVDGQKTYVLETRPNIRGALPDMRSEFHFRHADGVLVKVVKVDPMRRQIKTATLEEVKLDVKFAPDHFQFRNPPGVQMLDETRETLQRKAKEARERQNPE